MIHDIHPLVHPRGVLRYILWAIDSALGERGVRGVEGRFPEVGEFGEDVGHGGGVVVGAGVEEGDEARVVGDDLGEGGPGAGVGVGMACHRGVGVVGDVAGDEGVFEMRDVGVLRVGEQDGDDFVGVGVEPGFYGFEVVCQAAGVFHAALGVAEAELALSVEVGLGLEEADAGVELCGDEDVLVVHGEDADEGGVVGGYLGYVGVLSVAELNVAVTADFFLRGEVDEEGRNLFDYVH